MSVESYSNMGFLTGGYRESHVTLLSKDPHWLYAYWEITDECKSSFCRELGADTWEKSVPVLKITNVTRNDSFFVRINDFSNSWYVNVPDPNCLYVAEVGRKITDRLFINLAGSNHAVTPGSGPSSNNSAYFANYRDLKNGFFRKQPDEIAKYAGIAAREQAPGISSDEFTGSRKG